MRGWKDRPCRKDPRFPKFEDYELLVTVEGDRWWCDARGRTEGARQVSLRTGCGRSQEEAVKWVKRCPNPMLEDSEIEVRPEFEAGDFAT